MTEELDIHPTVKHLILQIWDEGLQMRAAGATLDAMQEHWRDRLITYVRQRGMITADRDLPPWLLRRCPTCEDSGWAPTTRIVRGEPVPAYTRCGCQGQTFVPQDDRDVAAKVSAGWKQVGRR